MNSIIKTCALSFLFTAHVATSAYAQPAPGAQTGVPDGELNQHDQTYSHKNQFWGDDQIGRYFDNVCNHIGAEIRNLIKSKSAGSANTKEQVQGSPG